MHEHENLRLLLLVLLLSISRGDHGDAKEDYIDLPPAAISRWRKLLLISSIRRPLNETDFSQNAPAAPVPPDQLRSFLLLLLLCQYVRSTWTNFFVPPHEKPTILLLLHLGRSLEETKETKDKKKTS